MLLRYFTFTLHVNEHGGSSRTGTTPLAVVGWSYVNIFLKQQHATLTEALSYHQFIVPHVTYISFERYIGACNGASIGPCIGASIGAYWCLPHSMRRP
jgi:uncharacterized protein YqgC (DUF456 family)